MQDDRKISIAIPSYERTDMTIQSFMDVYEDERISEIIIVDDFSEMSVYEKLEQLTENLTKVRLYRNGFNKDCYWNKATSLIYVTNEFAVLLDSDNKIDKSYIDKIFEIEYWQEDTIYTPDFAEPNFDFRNYSGVLLTKENVSEYIDKPLLEVCLNAANYFVNKNRYTKTWDGTTDPVTSDSIFMCLNWLNSGGKIQIVNGMKYFHRVWDKSHYKNNVALTPKGFHDSILQRLREMA